jgi:hypothetical protein
LHKEEGAILTLTGLLSAFGAFLLTECAANNIFLTLRISPTEGIISAIKYPNADKSEYFDSNLSIEFIL